MSEWHFTAGQAALWVQPSGPNTAPVYLGCHEVGDIEVPEGDVELITCPDPTATDRFRVVGSIQQAAGAVTAEVIGDIVDAVDALEQAYGQFTLFVHKIKKGRRDLFTNYDRTFILLNARRTSRTLSALASRSQDDNARSEQTFALSAEALLAPFPPTISRQSISETMSINDIAFCNARQERTADSPALDTCQIGYAVADADTGVAANVLRTTNGATWTATAADPFGADEHIMCVECFESSRDVTRILVARGVTDAGNPAEIAYSDDGGANWVAVDVGSTNGQYAPAEGSLFAFDRNNIWLGTTGGYIYKSEDAGLSWTTQEAGVIHVGAWNAIHFADALVGVAAGAANVIARTVDGGDTWAAVTGPSAQAGVAINTVWVFDRNRFWVGYADGDLYFTLDGGVTWEARSFSGSGVGQVRDIAFLNDLEGVMITNNASPVGTVQTTIDGGYTWEVRTTPPNSGLNAVFYCDEWKFFVAGEANSSTGFIAKASL